MKNDEIYREALEKHSREEVSRASMRRIQFTTNATGYATTAKRDLAELVVMDQIEDPSAYLEALDHLEKTALDLTWKQASNNEQKPPCEREQ